MLRSSKYRTRTLGNIYYELWESFLHVLLALALHLLPFDTGSVRSEDAKNKHAADSSGMLKLE